ncbi:recombinase family protein [Aminobacter niigataensis]|uniref:recombinase family protein n=1 Tax=Aminobacter niigataensis TaxID=83265 RepID=UPI003CD06E26
MATFLSCTAEFERDRISERVKSGLAAAKARGKKLGRQRVQRCKVGSIGATRSDARRSRPQLSAHWLQLGLTKNTIADIVQRCRGSIVAC